MSDLLVLMGPTGVGKSALAMQIAERLGLSIFYFEPVVAVRELTVGSAKPSEADRARIRHFGIDVTDLNHPFTLVDLYHHILPELNLHLKTQGLALVVTGSGFFLRALLHGIPALHQRRLPGEAPFVHKEEIYSRLTGGRSYPKIHPWKTDPDAALLCYQELQRVWPKRAAKVHAHDVYRVLRSLEVYTNHLAKIPNLTAFETIEQVGLLSEILPNIRVHPVGLYCHPEDHLRRLKVRVHRMLQQGWIEEVTRLRREGFSLTGSLKSVGYREVMAFLDGTLILQRGETLQDRVVRSHLKLAKKQMRWFSAYERGIWLNHSQFSTEELAAFIFQNQLHLD
jgi:tRNA dimethylallyltransferase